MFDIVAVFNTLNVISQYHMGSQYHVAFKDCPNWLWYFESSIVPLWGGVPQDSMLGPLFFTLYNFILNILSGYMAFLFLGQLQSYLCHKNREILFRQRPGMSCRNQRTLKFLHLNEQIVMKAQWWFHSLYWSGSLTTISDSDSNKPRCETGQWC